MDMLTPIWNYTKANVVDCIPSKNGRRLIGEHSNEHYWLLEERTKRLVRSMIQEIDDVHEQGFCLSSFSYNNWFVNSKGSAVYKGMTLIQKNEASIKKNYSDLHAVILKTIFRNQSIQQIPQDFKALLALMKHRPIGNSYLMRNYAALLPIENRIQFFMKAYELINFHLGWLDEGMKNRILSKLPYSKRWAEIVKGNGLLEYHFHYKTRDTSGSAEGFMEFYRDSNYHRMDICHQLPDVGEYDAEEYETVFLVKYPL
ncbi:hypothetical protein ACP4OV_008143 [Aristida adscensionis]